MVKTISAIKARQKLGQVMNEVSLREDEYIVERAGKPLVAIIPIEQYMSIKKDRSDFFGMVSELQRSSDAENIETDIEEAVKHHRRLKK
ncbi:MAG: type II toxin-antitoxin system Phd/YefM family antitoxin [Nitrospirae bacterium]|nr:type II toxin-antitoxin system Phd/YefM family antitoxin [Nitrospirota bacterium]